MTSTELIQTTKSLMWQRVFLCIVFWIYPRGVNCTCKLKMWQYIKKVTEVILVQLHANIRHTKNTFVMIKEVLPIQVDK